MSRKAVPHPTRCDPAPLRLLTPRQWASIASSLRLSPQQTRIVELIMQGKQDKEIAHEMKFAFSTLRTHLGRIFYRVGVEDRIGLILYVSAECLRACQYPRCP